MQTIYQGPMRRQLLQALRDQIEVLGGNLTAISAATGVAQSRLSEIRNGGKGTEKMTLDRLSRWAEQLGLRLEMDIRRAGPM